MIYPKHLRVILFSVDNPYDTVLEASVPDNIGVINSSIILTCTAHAYPPVTAYKIYHNGTLVSNSSTGIHNITRALAEHKGSYVCIPYNDVGRGESAALNVTFVGKLTRIKSGFAEVNYKLSNFPLTAVKGRQKY